MEEVSKKTNKNGKVYKMAVTAVMAAIICVLSPLSIPIGPVPISFANLAIYFAVYLLGWKMGTCSLLIYILIGLIGVPVFSGFTGGFAKLLGPTGGYIIGYIPMAIISGLFIEKSDNKLVHFLGMVLGLAVCYALGTAWFCYEAGAGLHKALGACVIPFIPGDLIKIIAAVILGPVIRRALVKANLIR